MAYLGVLMYFSYFLFLGKVFQTSLLFLHRKNCYKYLQLTNPKHSQKAAPWLKARNINNLRIETEDGIAIVYKSLPIKDERQRCTATSSRGLGQLHGKGEETFHISSWRNWLFRIEISKNAEAYQ